MKKLFKGKTILITGGTGFLGRAIIRELLKFNPLSIRVFSRDEVKHYKLLEMFNHNPKIRYFIGDIRDYNRILRACDGADIVIHAAALKRLDMLEYNVDESIKTNILGTLNVAQACIEKNIDKAIFISTDKACLPINTYGACKFVSERIFIESNYNKGPKKTVLNCVRYGNVLESTGSVIPFFKSKIKNNKKIPLTDKRMTRFIINQKQAVELIFKALKYGVGGEIFVPKLPAFKITDLIEILKEEYNANNNIDVIGIRPGEKIHESMLNSAEIPRTYDFEDMYVITSSIQNYGGSRKARYIKKGKKLTGENMEDYCSKNALISKEEVKKLFKKFNIL